VYVDSSVCEKVFNFLLGDRSINNSTKEWKVLFKCQMKSGAYSDTPFLVVTEALLPSIIPIAIGQQVSRFLYNSNPTFYLSSQELPKTNCYTYLGVPFSNDLELKPIIQRINNKARNALYSIKGFLKNPHIPIPYKRMLFSAIVIGQVSYYAPLLGPNKDRTRSTQTLVNSELYWIEGFSKGE